MVEDTTLGRQGAGGAGVPRLMVLAPMPTGDAADVRAGVERLAALGADGVFAGDHLFTEDLDPSGDVGRPGEPVTLLTAAGMADSRFVLALMVANVSFTTPVTVARVGAQMAQLFGGHRVWLGIGAGWNEPEFRSLGRPMPPHHHRLGLLREVAELLHALYRDGETSLDGDHVHVDSLPLAPRPIEPPRLLVGGGSSGVLDVGARHADVIDLNAPYQPPPAGSDLCAADARRRLRTTLTDIARAVEAVTSAAARYGRQPPVVSLNVDEVIVGDATAVVRAEARICRRWNLPEQSLAACPYVLLGDGDQVAAKLERFARVGVHAIAVERGVEWVCQIRG